MIEQQQQQKHNLQPFNPKEDDNIFAIIVIVQFNNKSYLKCALKP